MMPALPRWRLPASMVRGGTWLGRKLRVLPRLLADPAFREHWRLEHMKAPGLFQAGGRTAFDRYPDLFAALRDQLDGLEHPRVVSYGCSTGEEILSLRRYLPQARLAGIDISAYRIRVARRRIRDPQVPLMVGSSFAAAGAGQYDAIVCLSVLQHSRLVHDWPIDCAPYLSFSRFEQAIQDFDRHLAVGGLLLLFHTSFRFVETTVAARYQPVFCVAPLSLALRQCYDHQHRPVLEPRAERYALYRKLASS